VTVRGTSQFADVNVRLAGEAEPSVGSLLVIANVTFADGRAVRTNVNDAEAPDSPVTSPPAGEAMAPALGRLAGRIRRARQEAAREQRGRQGQSRPNETRVFAEILADGEDRGEAALDGSAST
jgi:hypothetical protein